MVDNDDELLNEKQSLVVISFLTEVDLCGKYCTSGATAAEPRAGAVPAFSY